MKDQAQSIQAFSSISAKYSAVRHQPHRWPDLRTSVCRVEPLNAVMPAGVNMFPEAGKTTSPHLKMYSTSP